MNLVQATKTIFEKRFPMSLASRSWDNVGLLIEAPTPRAQAPKVLLTIDLTTAVCREALADPQVGMIVAYHPPIFRPLKQLTLADPKQSILLQCVAKGVSVYSPHTAVDNNPDGNADWLATCLQTPIAACETILPCGDGAPGMELAGTGRLITLAEPQPLSTLIHCIKQALDLKYVRVGKSEKHWSKHADADPIRTVAICAGSGASVLTQTRADLYFTGEMSHHEVLAATESGTSVILCEHSNTERKYLSQVMQPFLRSEFQNLQMAYDVVCSQSDRDPLECA
ncbi:hypothetical protein H4R34_003566 [Dimargaris verticillata]|uniref:GTP cyclohydrolase 1 type 2/Nif3 n=1 Tax=Dimargaris verticillata TaxID=2761393 RepID=A0A9W8B1W8_9FUNG|nr:hypothetical protein H4R34_003566 [Dimargaris verticillata]